MKILIVTYFAISSILIAVMLKLEIECWIARKDCQDDETW